MANYSKKRGVISKDDDHLTMEEKRRQWNVNLANRALEQLFGQTNYGDGVVINNRFRKRVNYTPQELFEMAEQYFENIVEANENEIGIVPDIEDFCMFCHISRSKFLTYRKSDDADMAEVANNIANAIASCKKQNAYQGLINPMAFMADMNNNHDYVQVRTETTINSNISLQQVETSIADIASRLPIEDIPLIEGKVINEKGDN